MGHTFADYHVDDVCSKKQPNNEWIENANVKIVHKIIIPSRSEYTAFPLHIKSNYNYFTKDIGYYKAM